MVSRFLMVFAIAALGLASPTRAEPVLYEKRVKSQLHSQVELSKKQKKGYKEFRKEMMYFGAIYVQPGSDAYLWMRNGHTLQDVMKAAREGCRNDAGRKGVPCVLYATMTPYSFNGSKSDKNGLSRSAMIYYTGKYRNKLEAGRYAALAINGLNNWGGVINRKSAEDVKQTALETCQSTVLRNQAKYGEKVRRTIKESGQSKCRLVDVRRKPTKARN